MDIKELVKSHNKAKAELFSYVRGVMPYQHVEGVAFCSWRKGVTEIIFDIDINNEVKISTSNLNINKDSGDRYAKSYIKTNIEGTANFVVKNNILSVDFESVSFDGHGFETISDRHYEICLEKNALIKASWRKQENPDY